MTPEHLLSELTALGVRLWADGDALRFRAPAGALGAAHRAALRAHKPALLALLASADTPAATPDPAARHAPFPLTDVQTAYLLGRRDSFDLGGVACHGYLEVTFPALPPAAAEDAWNLLVARHDMLRATIHPDGHQQVLPEVPRYRIAAADLRGADPAALAAHLDRTRAELDHAVYDPATWPLFTLRITRTDAGDILHTSLDTLVADWASAGILFAELDAVLAGRADTLPPLALTFRDYLVAERRLRDTPRYARDRAYWLERAADLPPAPELPAAPAAGPPAGPPRFARHAYRLPADRWAALTAQAGAHDLTPATAVLAAYAAVLRRWSRHPRFALSVTLLNRLPLHPDVDRIVGDFTSVNVLDVADPAGRPFAAAATALGTRLYTDLDHRLFSGVEVLREVTRRRGREAARLPVVFTSALGAAAGIDSRGAGRPGYGVTQTPQVVLDCQVGEDAGELVVHWDVRQGVLPDGVAADMFAAFTDLLAALAAGPEAWADPHPVPLPAWQAAERAAANDTAGPLPDRLLTDGFLARAAADPDRVAVLDAAGPTTYGALAGSAAAVAAALRARGVTAGQVVAVLAPKGVAQVAAVLGCGLAGAVYLPVDVHQPPLRRARLLADADARLVLTAAGTDTAGVGECPVVAVDTLAPADPPAPGGGDPDAPAYVIYTSGSTGAPKGVLVSHRAAANTIDDIDRRYGVGADDRVLGLAQLGFDLSVYDIFGPLTRGGTLVLPDPARPGDPSHWADLVRTHGVTVWNSVPAQLGMLLDYLGTAQLPSLRLALASGDWLPTTLPARCAAALPAARLVSLGGATEAAIWSIAHPVDAVDPAWPSIPYGRPLANQGWRVRAADGRDAPVWTAGELCITGAGLALGYLGDAALTAARFPTADGQRLYRTGDLGRYRPGGDIEFLGREDGQVKLRGHRIELGEVEAALAAHPDVADAAAVVAGTGADRALLGFVTPR
ncbi:MAG TPA: amino acid adenylation domain-containing protein, partial [Pilimelia sp.]|nr:amino acid adenylation domain-containing protein [Pilimelia sp.]